MYGLCSGDVTAGERATANVLGTKSEACTYSHSKNCKDDGSASLSQFVIEIIYIKSRLLI